MISQTIFYLLARLISVFMSFFLFAWVGRVLLPEEAAKAFFCIFILGFCLATARMSSQVGAAVSSQSRRTQRCRDVRRGHHILLFLLVPLCLLGALSVWFYTRSLMLGLIAGFFILIASPNVDLVRGMLDKAPVFPAAFSAGTLLSLILIQWVLPSSLEGVVLGLLCQWLFVGLVNMRIFRRVFRFTLRDMPSGALILSCSILACFDGVVLNAPFFGFVDPSSRLAEILSLSVRVFVASLPILPLLIHWTNSKVFHDFCEKRRFSLKFTFKVMMFVSGVVCGLGFMGVYVFIAKKVFVLEALYFYLLLLVAYSIFVPELRFSFKAKPSYSMSLVLLFVLAMYLVLMMLSVFMLNSTGWIIVSLQVGALLLAAWVLRLSGRMFSPPVSELE